MGIFCSDKYGGCWDYMGQCHIKVIQVKNENMIYSTFYGTKYLIITFKAFSHLIKAFYYKILGFRRYEEIHDIHKTTSVMAFVLISPCPNIKILKTAGSFSTTLVTLSICQQSIYSFVTVKLSS